MRAKGERGGQKRQENCVHTRSIAPRLFVFLGLTQRATTHRLLCRELLPLGWVFDEPIIKHILSGTSAIDYFIHLDNVPPSGDGKAK